MSTVAEERVLVLPTSEFHALGHFQGFSAELDTYLPALLESDNLSYRPRSVMEEDPSFKQLIPYMLFRHTDAEGTQRLFQYTRGGGHGRGRGSTPSAASALAGTYFYRGRRGGNRSRCLSRRNVAGIGRRGRQLESPYTEQCVGLINDDETPVGQVHLGVVHMLRRRECLNVHATRRRHSRCLISCPYRRDSARTGSLRIVVADRGRQGALWLTPAASTMTR